MMTNILYVAVILFAVLYALVLEGKLGILWCLHRRGPKWNPSHGPQSWPWWRWFSVKKLRMRYRGDSGATYSGYRFWFYTRWVDVLVDVLRVRQPI